MMSPLAISSDLERRLLTLASTHGASIEDMLWNLLDQAEQENQVLQRLFEMAQDMMSIISVEGHFKRVNPAFLRTLGYTPQEMLDRKFIDLIHEESREYTRTQLAKASNGTPVRRFENRFLCKDGTYRWVAWVLTPLLDAQEIYVVGRDITNLKQTQHDLASAHAQINSILESITDAFFALDHDWRFTYINAAAEPLMFHTRAEMLGLNIWDIFPEAVNTVFHTEYHRVAEENISSSFVAYYPPHDIWYDVSAYPSQHGIAVYFRNVNERIRAEEARVTAERLQVELEKEKEIRRVKSQLISMVTHDIRNPLTGAHLTLTNLEHALPSLTLPEIRDRFSIIQQQLKNMDDLIEDLMVFSSIEQRKIIHKPIEIDLDVFCSRVLWEFKETISTRHDFTYESHNLDATAHLDPHLMQRALTNLLSNAVKYSPDGSLIEIELAADEDTVAIHIRDHGIGIADEEQAGIFEAFQRAANSHHKRGTGLGLTVVKQIVELHSGSVSVTSKLHEGSTFSVQLPKYEGE